MTGSSTARGGRGGGRPRGPSAVGRGLLAGVRFYQRAVSPALPPRCRFYPTCSAYAAEAIERHGAARGGWLAVRRLAKCAPWHPGGVDLVPGAARPGPSPAVPDGPVDAGPVDTRTVDAGTVDAGPADTGTVDAGTVDAARSSTTPASPPGPGRSLTTAPQAPRRATQEESSVA